MARSSPDVLARLADVFRRVGYDGASLSRLSDASGLGRASLYHQFPDGKRDIARRAVEHANRAFHEAVLAQSSSDGPPAERLRRVARALARYYDDGADPCLLGALTLSETDPRLNEVVRAGFDAWIDALAAILRDAGLPRALARTRSEDAVARIQGALLLGRALDHHRPLRRALADLATLART